MRHEVSRTGDSDEDRRQWLGRVAAAMARALIEARDGDGSTTGEAPVAANARAEQHDRQ